MKMMSRLYKKKLEDEEVVTDATTDSNDDSSVTSTEDDSASSTNNEKHHQPTTGEKIKETATDKKFLQGAGVGFLAGAATGATITHMIDKKKHKKEEKKRLAQEKHRRQQEEKQRLKELEEQKQELEKIQKDIDKKQKEKDRKSRDRKRREAAAAARIRAPVVTVPVAYGYPPQAPPQQAVAVAQAYPIGNQPPSQAYHEGAPYVQQPPQQYGYGAPSQIQYGYPPPQYNHAAPPPQYNQYGGYGGQPQTVVYREERRGMDPGMAMLGGFIVGDILGGGGF